MATWKPELHNADDVLNYYDQYDEAGYSVFAGHKPDQAYCRFTYTGNDKAIGREKLAEALASVQSNPDNTNVYLLQILGPKGRKMETKNAITFQLNKSQSLMPYNAVGYSPAISNEMAAMKNQINELQMRLLERDAMEDEMEEDEDEDEGQNFLSGIMANPQVKSMIINMISNLVTPARTTNVQHVSGVMDGSDIEADEKIDEAIERLKKVDDKLGDDLMLLCEMAENDPMQFKFLLKMLRGK